MQRPKDPQTEVAAPILEGRKQTAHSHNLVLIWALRPRGLLPMARKQPSLELHHSPCLWDPKVIFAILSLTEGRWNLWFLAKPKSEPGFRTKKATGWILIPPEQASQFTIYGQGQSEAVPFLRPHT